MIKVFIQPLHRADYRGSPAISFEFTVPYVVSMSEVNGEPLTEQGFLTVEIGIDSSPASVYAVVYEKIKALCAANGWPEPSKADVFGFVPMDFNTLIP